ncbi:MAG: helicase domain protein [Marmoricola sp.]|nr:helicase domain protein [Marmoricola sp.]
MCFGRGVAEDDKGAMREGQVRMAFNSPFWPFVLASTSVGQEGLDFHHYSHAIVHWNLPSNPVDLEQREGRVHRYQGHAVRRNIAAGYGSRRSVVHADNPWAEMFELAADDRPDGVSEIYPSWIPPLAGSARIERYVPALPLSKESHALRRLLRTVGAYRLVLGQPRQEDLLRYLGDRASALHDLTINLEP